MPGIENQNQTIVNETNKIEIIHKELDLIESIITRMANNSFMLKGWAITLFIGIITLYNIVSFPKWILSVLLAVVIIGFGYLDAFYLSMERKYTSLYSDVRKKRLSGDYKNLYSLNAEDSNKETVWNVIFNKKYGGLWKGLKRNTIIIFYGSMLIVTLIFSIVSFAINKDNDKQSYEIKVMEANVDIADIRKYMNNVSNSIENLNVDLNTLASKVKEINSEIAGTNNSLNDLESSITSLKNDILKFDGKIVDLDKKIQIVQNRSNE